MKLRNLILLLLTLGTVGMPAVSDGHDKTFGHKDEILSMNEREFYVGEMFRPDRLARRSFYFEQTPFLSNILDDEELLRDWRVKFFLTGLPAMQSGGPPPGNSRLTENFLAVDDPNGLFDGYIVYEGPPRQIILIPKRPMFFHMLRCGRNFGDEFLSTCNLYAVYPHDTHIILRAQKFFPGRIEDLAPRVSGMANRMIEIAICLDTTGKDPSGFPDQPMNSALELPEFNDCEIELLS